MYSLIKGFWRLWKSRRTVKKTFNGLSLKASTNEGALIITIGFGGILHYKESPKPYSNLLRSRLTERHSFRIYGADFGFRLQSLSLQLTV